MYRCAMAASWKCLWRSALATFMLTVSVVSGGKVLISATGGEGSHYVAATAIGKALVQRGHNVTVLIGNAFEHRAHDPFHAELDFEIFSYSGPPEEVRARFEKVFSHAFEKSFGVDLIRNITKIMAPFVEDCRTTLADRALMERLLRAKFDAIIFDITWQCSLLIAAQLNTTNVFLNPMASQYFVAEMVAGAPFLPAVMPNGAFCYPQRMTFLQRVSNVILSLLWKAFSDVYTTATINPVKEEFDILPDKSVMELLTRDIDLLLMATDPVIDAVGPFPPSVVQVGGLLTRPSKPLLKDLDDFMNSAGDDGVIVLSLGTYVKVMPQRLNDLFASVFAGLPQKVVWQLPEGSPTNLSANVRTMDWLPQNDLLGHPKTRLFIYQGGNNGLYEALYHGVPVIVLPVFADQICVAARVTEKGMGQSIDIHSLRAEDLNRAIKEVLLNETFHQNAKKLSAIYRDRPETPAQRAAFWVEHVMKHGGDYMRMPSKDLSFFQLYLFDVMAFLVLCFIVFAVLSFFFCRCMFRCCRRSCRFLLGSKEKQD